MPKVFIYLFMHNAFKFSPFTLSVQKCTGMITWRTIHRKPSKANFRSKGSQSSATR